MQKINTNMPTSMTIANGCDLLTIKDAVGHVTTPRPPCDAFISRIGLKRQKYYRFL